MKSKELKKLLSGISVLSLLAGAGCAATETRDAAEVKHPTPGSIPMNMTS
ncbi:MAG: selenobiotic family radical SAM modification target peptide [Deltaproteobacteria bacterium]|nr:selenobiotic family radical SAM modification target peptide [Deltaproteobacteria bacterium]